MDNEKRKKEIYFADAILGAITHVQTPMLMYGEEKEVVRKALSEYRSKLESELMGY